jgi:hypothetical protein
MVHGNVALANYIKGRNSVCAGIAAKKQQQQQAAVKPAPVQSAPRDPRNIPTPQTQHGDPRNIPTPQTQQGKPQIEARNVPTPGPLTSPGVQISPAGPIAPRAGSSETRNGSDVWHSGNHGGIPDGRGSGPNASGRWIARGSKADCDNASDDVKQTAAWYNACVSDPPGIDRRNNDCERDPNNKCHGQIISPQELFVLAKERCGDAEDRICIARQKENYLLANDSKIKEDCPKYSGTLRSECVDWYYLNNDPDETRSYNHSRYLFKFLPWRSSGSGPTDSKGTGANDPQRQASAEQHLKESQDAIVASRSSKGDALIDALQRAEEAFRAAAGDFMRLGDDDRRDAALHEAARMALMRWVEGHDGKKPTSRECSEISRHFRTIDKDSSQANNLVTQIKKTCEPIVGEMT